jgi:hypothetical protein
MDIDDLEQPEKELAMASFGLVPEALSGCGNAADAAVGGGNDLSAMLASLRAVGKGDRLLLNLGRHIIFQVKSSYYSHTVRCALCKERQHSQKQEFFVVMM